VQSPSEENYTKQSMKSVGSDKKRNTHGRRGKNEGDFDLKMTHHCRNIIDEW
jgi:hypothetical protein